MGGCHGKVTGLKQQPQLKHKIRCSKQLHTAALLLHSVHHINLSLFYSKDVLLYILKVTVKFFILLIYCSAIRADFQRVFYIKFLIPNKFFLSLITNLPLGGTQDSESI